jgi:hypothetical protein
MSTRRDVTAGSYSHRSQGDTDAARAALRARAYELRAIRGMTLRQIGDELGVHHTTVHTWLREEISNRLDPLKDQYLQYELDRLDHMQQATLVVLDNPGRVVTVMVAGPPDEEGNPTLVPRDHIIVDDRKILGAIDRLIRISESRRKLCGLDAPVKVSADVSGQIDVHETTQADLELQELLREAKARAAAAAEKIKNGDPT